MIATDVLILPYGGLRGDLSDSCSYGDGHVGVGLGLGRSGSS